jgi:hypothetical protein
VAAIDVAPAHPPPEEPSPHCALRKEHHVVDEDVLDPSLDLSNGQASSATLAGICSEQIDDGTLARYKSFANELLAHQIQALRDLFSKDTPRDVDVAAQSALQEAAC